jgi:acetate---CoA ligase (ADP-forming)
MPSKEEGPAHPVGGVRLRDGTQVRLRPAAPEDRAAVTEFASHLSLETTELRFRSPGASEVAVAEILRSGAPRSRFSLVMERIGDGPHEIIGHGEWVRCETEPDRAEVAFVIADRYQGEGAATMLLQDLARRARAAGIHEFEAYTLPENQAMIATFLGAGFPCIIDWVEGETRVRLDIARDPPAGFVPGSRVGAAGSTPS